MRIAILSPFYPFRGGVAQISDRVYLELSKQNKVKAFSFNILYPNFLFPGKTQFVSESEHTTSLNNDRILNSINPLSYIATAKKINEYSPDILIIPYWISFLAPAFGIICRLLNKKIKVISLVHNAIPHEKRFFDNSFARFFFKKCDGFIVLSESVKKDLEKIVSNTNILLTPHPIYDHYKEKIGRKEACAILQIPENKKNLLFFGLIREYKGLDILINTMSFLDDSYQLVIAGESYGDFKKYQELIDKSPLKNNIKVLEQYIPDEMVTTLFSATDVLILPYRSATQSGVLAVAYQLEIPTIATNTGALGDMILSSGTGVVVNEITSESIAKAIKSYFTDIDKQTEYLINIKREKERLSWNKMGETLQTFFNGLT